MSVPGDATFALHWVTCLAGLAVFLSSLELLSLRREFLSGGFYYADRELANLTAPRWLPRAAWLAGAPYPVFYCLVGLRLVFAALLALDLPSGGARVAVLFATVAISLFIGLRLEFGMSGADPMMGVVLCGLGLMALAPENVLVQRTGLWFIALQTAFAYTAAGVTKIYIPAWRDGTYLMTALGSEIYGHPFAARTLRNRKLACLMSWVVILWECTFPLAFLLGGTGAIVYCAIGLVFHASIAVFMGLKMFVFIFGATYPAIIACALQVHSLRIPWPN